MPSFESFEDLASPPFDAESTTKGRTRRAQDSLHGDIRLEEVTQPLYDTQMIPEGTEYKNFFQGPAGRGYAQSNLDTIGCLTWPKRFFVTGFEVMFDRPTWIEDVYFSFTVGEKRYFGSAVAGMDHKENAFGAYTAQVHTRIYIPSVQHFSARLEWPQHRRLQFPTVARVVLNGQLYREIQ